ncbi:MAG: metal-dependent transcriptional regulator [Spirochaetia bacterium]|nr:metal-dependent transcriptional regulator [Spirochaetia bacterium]
MQKHDKRKLNVDHILGQIYILLEKQKEKDGVLLSKLISVIHEKDEFATVIEEIYERKFAKKNQNKVKLTSKGVKKAEAVVRAFRLGMRFMTDVLGISVKNAEKAADLMEHLVETETLDALCTFMGHPASSPAGEKMPSGDCCRRKLTSVQPLSVKLTALQPGEKALVKYIQNPESFLSNMGVIPGETIKLLEKRPSAVIEVGSTTLALDKKAAEHIYVKPIK